MDVRSRLLALGVTIPGAGSPSGTFSPVVRDGNLVFTSGQTAKVDGAVAWRGQLGAGVSLDEGKAAARQCALNCLSLLNDYAGGLDNIERIVKVTGFVNSAPGFTQQGAVIEAASLLLFELFGENGLHARSSIGVAALPGDSACEIEMIVRIRS